MLNSETKQKINALRDTLVGKIPTPTGQVEQITLALLYKFMGDIDDDVSTSLGGKSFFDGEFKKFSWSNLINPKTSGTERAKLYADGLESMALNPNLPDLFKDIFKNAYIPFKDPETISMFLKQINEFKYDNSEDLGDAFEYLLSVMGSQGDAGQFRTPRHIIDFIVEVVEPKMDDRILDPACGTAGFLISAYTYLVKHYKPTAADRSSFTNNFVGYDISGDMVRLSRVNMYLHHFPNPQIFEYDSLTSEDKWKDKFETILANPPFMTPKGGIKPHSKFAVKANRSEVLFVDYIMEHLSEKGKAGIIVPEGIIFQSASVAYRNLRKMMITDNYLWAVVSLPSGVFKPYSGVKTSILLIDKKLASEADNILFVKVGNDGFDLGAQRKEIQGSELPSITRALKEYKKNLQLDIPKENYLLVNKRKIAESGDYNLSGDRYKTFIKNTNQRWPMVKLSELVGLLNGFAFKSSDYVNISNTLNLRMSNIRVGGILDLKYSPKYLPDSFVGKYQSFLVEDGDVVIAMTDLANDPKILGIPTIVKSNGEKILLNQRVGKFTDIDFSRISLPYLKYILQSSVARNIYKSLGGGGLQINISKKDILSLQIPLPPVSIQEKIVEELDLLQKSIEKNKQEVVENEQKIKDRIKEVWGE